MPSSYKSLSAASSSRARGLASDLEAMRLDITDRSVYDKLHSRQTCLFRKESMVSSPISATQALPSALARPARRAWISDKAAFGLLASLAVSFLAGSSAPTPLYGLYQAHWGFSPIITTVAFGIYALAVLGSLLTVGRLSDHVGRRPVLLVAVLVQALTMLLFATVDGVGALLTARFVQGLSTGGALGAIGAGLVDLDRSRGTLANSVAPMIGTATGGIVSGLLVQYLPAPEQLVYLALGVVFVAQA